MLLNPCWSDANSWCHSTQVNYTVRPLTVWASRCAQLQSINSPDDRLTWCMWKKHLITKLKLQLLNLWVCHFLSVCTSIERPSQRSVGEWERGICSQCNAAADLEDADCDQQQKRKARGASLIASINRWPVLLQLILQNYLFSLLFQTFYLLFERI